MLYKQQPIPASTAGVYTNGSAPADSSGGTLIASKRQSRNRYQLPSIEKRTVFAAKLVKQSGLTLKHAAALACVNVGYVSLVQRLSEDDRQKLSRGELKLASLWRDYCRGLAERRRQRLAAEREAEAQAECEAETSLVDHCLACVGFDRVVERIVMRFGLELVLEELDLVLQRNGRDFGIDQLTRPAARALRFTHMSKPTVIAAE
jgi:hypothetical protein